MVFIGALAFLILCGAIYGAYWLISGMSIEYEYILTNGEIDVDKIIAQRKRKRLVTVSAKTFEAFGPYKPEEHVNRNYDSRILACESETSDGQCIMLNSAMVRWDTACWYLIPTTESFRGSNLFFQGR